jgi:fibronectin type 3 domain-containing protein
LTGGNDYVFRVSAKNAHGHGTASNTVTLTTATAPGAPGTPTVTLTDTTIVISWTAGGDNNDAITAYRVKIENSSGTGVEDTAECDGTDSTIVADRSCTFTMATLLSAPYSLSVGAPIIATVEAMNNYGYGAVSADSNGALLV